ncbi:hypothetical protein [Mesorhizobium sp. M1A.F.Ca.IN.022.02.1.1]|uniref:hypothetical protein n=1 Tax=Mesorhizobium sp. M1A.F.Ca.IN.022.02.1.1 TaxID=2496766 RepID=UPI001FE1D764|nr:hypothetical protein [Mesorhizobium sp. M1A.F.Ca.IN.022.02.1.1]
MAAAYTEKEIDEIAAWLKEGLSASRIAGRFSALRGSPVSRNARSTGARPGPDMLCCGLPTSATRSYCAHHHARFHGHRGRGM